MKRLLPDSDQKWQLEEEESGIPNEVKNDESEPPAMKSKFCQVDCSSNSTSYIFQNMIKAQKITSKPIGSTTFTTFAIHESNVFPKKVKLPVRRSEDTAANLSAPPTNSDPKNRPLLSCIDMKNSNILDCLLCKYKATNKIQMAKHVCKTHLRIQILKDLCLLPRCNNRGYKCPQCDFGDLCTTKNELITHYGIVHNKIVPLMMKYHGVDLRKIGIGKRQGHGVLDQKFKPLSSTSEMNGKLSSVSNVSSSTKSNGFFTARTYASRPLTSIFGNEQKIASKNSVTIRGANNMEMEINFRKKMAEEYEKKISNLEKDCDNYKIELAKSKKLIADYRSVEMKLEEVIAKISSDKAKDKSEIAKLQKKVEELQKILHQNAKNTWNIKEEPKDTIDLGDVTAEHMFEHDMNDIQNEIKQEVFIKEEVHEEENV